MELIQSLGLELILYSAYHRAEENWCTSAPSGFLCGTLTEGEIDTAVESIGHNRLSDQIDNSSYNLWLNNETEIWHQTEKAVTLSGAFIRISPDHLENLLGEEAGLMQQSDTPSSALIRERSMLSALAWQMRGCPLSGSARKLFLLGKAMEYVSLLVHNKIEAQKGAGNDRALRNFSSKDVKRLQEARSILLDRLEDPPGIVELASLVGLNSRKLGEGFKFLFGTSVYAFVKEQRLEHAFMLLQNGETTVAQAAYACGYQPAHFSTEFRRRFGVPPSAFTIGRKRPI